MCIFGRRFSLGRGSICRARSCMKVLERAGHEACWALFNRRHVRFFFWHAGECTRLSGGTWSRALIFCYVFLHVFVFCFLTVARRLRVFSPLTHSSLRSHDTVTHTVISRTRHRCFPWAMEGELINFNRWLSREFNLGTATTRTHTKRNR